MWRGGGTIAATLVLQVMQQERAGPGGLAPGGPRRVWVVDSFAGLPKASNGHDKDVWSEIPELAVSLGEVQRRFHEWPGSSMIIIAPPGIPRLNIHHSARIVTSLPAAPIAAGVLPSMPQGAVFPGGDTRLSPRQGCTPGAGLRAGGELATVSPRSVLPYTRLLAAPLRSSARVSLSARVIL